MRTIEIAPTVSSVVTINLGDSATMAAGYTVNIVNRSNFTAVIGRATASDTINNIAANDALLALNSITYKISSTGNGYVTASRGTVSNVTSSATSMTLGTTVTSTSGTAINFAGFPATTKRITVNFSGVSTNGTDNWLVQLGDSGGIENTGYLGSSRDSSSGANSTAGFLIKIGSASAVVHGSMIISLENSNTNTWSAFAILGRSDGTEFIVSGGSKPLSAVLTQLSITTTGATNTFDAGEINVSYES